MLKMRHWALAVEEGVQTLQAAQSYHSDVLLPLENPEGGWRLVKQLWYYTAMEETQWDDICPSWESVWDQEAVLKGILPKMQIKNVPNWIKPVVNYTWWRPSATGGYFSEEAIAAFKLLVT